MKKIVTVCFVLCMGSTLFALSWVYAGLDAGAVQDAFLKHRSSQIYAEIGLGLDDEFALKIPVAVSFSKYEKLIEAGISLSYFPLKNGLFFEMSLIKFGYMRGRFLNLNEVCVGWQFTAPRGFTLEPSVCFRDPSSVFSSEYSEISSEFDSYPSLRIRLILGWKYTLRRNEK